MLNTIHYYYNLYALQRKAKCLLPIRPNRLECENHTPSAEMKLVFASQCLVIDLWVVGSHSVSLPIAWNQGISMCWDSYAVLRRAHK